MIVHIIRINDSVEKLAFRSQRNAAEHVKTKILPRLQQQLRDSGRPAKFETVGESRARWYAVGMTVFLDTVDLEP